MISGIIDTTVSTEKFIKYLRVDEGCTCEVPPRCQIDNNNIYVHQREPKTKKKGNFFFFRNKNISMLSIILTRLALRKKIVSRDVTQTFYFSHQKKVTNPRQIAGVHSKKKKFFKKVVLGLPPTNVSWISRQVIERRCVVMCASP